MKTLLLTVGLPLSGKTTWAKSKGFPIVNPDSIRLALHGKRFEKLAEPFVWAIAIVMVRALFLAGHDKVVVDATNNTKKRRDQWMCDDWVTVLHHVTTPAEVCIQRAKERNDPEIVPVIQRMDAERDWLTSA